MWRLMCLGQTQQSVQALAILQQLPQLSAGLRSGSAAAALHRATSPVQQLQQAQSICSVQLLQQQYHMPKDACNSSHQLCYSTTADPSSSTASSSDSTSQPQPEDQQDQPVDPPAVETEASVSSDPSNMQAAAAAGRYMQFAHVEPSGFVTLPPRATASGYPESFKAADRRGSRRRSIKLPIEQVQLPQERLRIQLRQEVQQEEAQGGEVDAYSLSRSLIPGAHSFDSAAAAATAADTAPQQQQQQLSAEDRQLLEKLVGIMTKEGKKSRARRLLLDAMHIIKQQVAKGQHV